MGEGSQCTNGNTGVGVDRKPCIWGGDVHEAARTHHLGYKLPLLFPTADVLDDRVGEPDIELIVGEGSDRPSATTRRTSGNACRKAGMSWIETAVMFAGHG